jgi:hypothetical protein
MVKVRKTQSLALPQHEKNKSKLLICHIVSPQPPSHHQKGHQVRLHYFQIIPSFLLVVLP